MGFKVPKGAVDVEGALNFQTVPDVVFDGALKFQAGPIVDFD